MEPQILSLPLERATGLYEAMDSSEEACFGPLRDSRTCSKLQLGPRRDRTELSCADAASAEYSTFIFSSIIN